MRQLFVVFEQRGGPWDWSKGLRDQDGFSEHAAFMDALVAEGSIVLGGPLDDREVLLVLEAESADAVNHRLAADPWIVNGMLAITSIRPWTILLKRRAN